jgi:hypothetical protein
MDLTGMRVAGVVGMVLVGVLTAVGAFAVSFLVAGVVRAGFTVANWVSGINVPTTGAGDRAGAADRSVERGSRLADGAEHALLARQAWWRLPC